MYYIHLYKLTSIMIKAKQASELSGYMFDLVFIPPLWVFALESYGNIYFPSSCNVKTWHKNK